MCFVLAAAVLAALLPRLVVFAGEELYESVWPQNATYGSPWKAYGRSSEYQDPWAAAQTTNACIKARKRPCYAVRRDIHKEIQKPET